MQIRRQLIRFASSDNNLVLFHFDERKICSSGKHVLKYFMSRCLKNVLLLPISIKMHQNSKNVHTLKEKGKIFSTKFVIVLYQSSKISSCVHSLHLNKYLVETYCLLFLKLKSHWWHFWSDLWMPNVDIMALMVNKTLTTENFLKNSVDQKSFANCLFIIIKIMPQKTFVAEIWPINKWKKILSSPQKQNKLF